MYNNYDCPQIESLSGEFFSLLSDRKDFKNLLLFCQRVISHGKLVEILSFLVWDILYQIGFYRNNALLIKENPICISSKFFMKIHDEVITNFQYGFSLRQTIPWKLVHILNNNLRYGCLYSNQRALYRQYKNNKPRLVYIFPDEIIAFHITKKGTILVSINGGHLYKGYNENKKFRKVLTFSNKRSYFRFKYGITNTPENRIIIGEYGNITKNKRFVSVAYLYYSEDEGDTWKKSDFLPKYGINKHIHMVRYNKLLNSVVLTDGDNKKKIWSGSTESVKRSDWNLINKFHINMGGYTAMEETKNKIILGTDYHCGSNFLVETRDMKTFIKHIIPEPYRKCPVYDIIQRSSKNGNEIWVNLHNSSCISGTKSALIFSKDGGKSWDRLLEYNGNRYRLCIISDSHKTANRIYGQFNAISKSKSSKALCTFMVSD